MTRIVLITGANRGKKVEAEHGRVDVLVNNVGGLFGYDQPSAVSLDKLQEVLELNLFTKWRTTQAFLPLVRGSENGRIVNVSSEAGSIARMGAHTSAYSASKAAVNAFTAALAAELEDEGITVHAASPGGRPPTSAARAVAPSPRARAASSASWTCPPTRAPAGSTRMRRLCPGEDLRAADAGQGHPWARGGATRICGRRPQPSTYLLDACASRVTRSSGTGLRGGKVTPVLLALRPVSASSWA